MHFLYTKSKTLQKIIIKKKFFLFLASLMMFNLCIAQGSSFPQKPDSAYSYGNAKLLNKTDDGYRVNANPGFYAFWADGNGRKPSDSHLYFSDKKGNVFMLPTEIKKSGLKPKKMLYKKNKLE